MHKYLQFELLEYNVQVLTIWTIGIQCTSTYNFNYWNTMHKYLQFELLEYNARVLTISICFW